MAISPGTRAKWLLVAQVLVLPGGSVIVLGSLVKVSSGGGVFPWLLLVSGIVLIPTMSLMIFRERRRLERDQ